MMVCCSPDVLRMREVRSPCKITHFQYKIEHSLEQIQTFQQKINRKSTENQHLYQGRQARSSPRLRENRRKSIENQSKSIKVQSKINRKSHLRNHHTRYAPGSIPRACRGRGGNHPRAAASLWLCAPLRSPLIKHRPN